MNDKKQNNREMIVPIIGIIGIIAIVIITIAGLYTILNIENNAKELQMGILEAIEKLTMD